MTAKNIDAEQQFELRLEQYRLLRAEVMSLVAEIRKMEITVTLGIASLYGWLAVNKHPHSMIWYLGTLFVVLAGIRVLSLFGRLRLIAEYMRNIELLWPNLGIHVRSGWERQLRYKLKTKRNYMLRSSAYLVWGILVFVSLIAPRVFTVAAQKVEGDHSVSRGQITDGKTFTNLISISNQVKFTDPSKAQ